MMNPISKNQCKVPSGTVIVGKWHSNHYTILKELGYGANGIVYLAQHRNTHVALKMSENSMSITSEVNVLKSFAKVQGSALGPSLLDVDDWIKGRGQISFYVMEYIHGPDLLSFLQQKGKSWTTVLFLQLLHDLNRLHENGWVFGDLKPENLIVTGPPPRIRCIDVGGTTIQGRAIKEYTEFFDRGYWGLGTRKAEPSYDLFSVAMMMINTAYPKRFSKTTGGIVQLKAMIRQQAELLPFETVILKSLQGYYTSAKQMRSDLVDMVMDKKITEPSTRYSGSLNPKQTKPPLPKNNINGKHTRQAYRKKKKKSGLIESWIITVVMIIILGMGMWYITTK